MSFSDEISRFANRSKSNLEAVTTKVLLDIGTRLVMRSPVGDAKYWKSKPPAGYVGGRFRANWQYGYETPILNEVVGTDKSGSKTIGTISGKIIPKPAIHYLTNNVPYAKRIENGWSRQAPAGLVAITKAEFQGVVDIAVSGVK
jgi:hypothetical protein